MNNLSNIKSDDYVTCVEELLSAYKAVGCNMPLKVHFLHSHQDFFPENFGAILDEYGDWFHQGISQFERKFFREMEFKHVGRILLFIGTKNTYFRI